MNSGNSTPSQTTCLVIGGAGFVGSYLCKELLKQDCVVYVIDKDTAQTRKSLSEISASPRLQFIPQKDKFPIFEATIDYIFHTQLFDQYLTSPHGIKVPQVDSYLLRGSLETAKKYQAKYLLLTYVDLEIAFQQLQSSRAHTQLNQYLSETKRLLETLISEYVHNHHLDARIVRTGFIYGPGMPLEASHLISEVLLSVAQKASVSLPNDGLQPLYPTYIEDLIYGIIKAMFSQSSTGKVYELIHPTGVTSLHLVYLLRDILKKEVSIKFYTTSSQDSQTSITNAALISQEHLGWKPKFELLEGVQKTLPWLDEQFQTHKLPRISVSQPELNPPDLAQPDLNSSDLTQLEIIPPNLAQLEIGQSTISQPTISQPDSNPPKPASPSLEHQLRSISNSQSGTHYPTQAQNTVHLTIQPSVVKKSAWQRFKLLAPGSSPSTSRSGERSRRGKRKLIFSIAGALIVVLLAASPYLTTIFFAQKLHDNLLKSAYAIENHQTDELQVLLAKAELGYKIIEFSNSLVQIEQNLFSISLPEKTYQQVRQGREVLTIIQDIYQVEISIQELSEIISNQKLGDPKIVTQEIYLYLQQINERLAVLEAELSDEPNSSFQTVSQWRSHVKASQQIITILPDLLAYDDKKTLLVILQDNQELRPTGGFIESVAEITVEKGHILDFQVNDIYSLDAQLKGSVEPPPAIKDYLGEDNWWLRDANLSPDFPSTASRIAWFYQKETGKLVDGVIAINTAGFKTLLTNQNELYLTDFDEYVNATNLGEHAHSHAEVNFFGQDGKDHNFSGALAKEYYQKTISLKGRELTQFALNLYQALEENQISIWLPETDSFSIIGQTGWDGSLRKPPTQLAEFGNIDVSDYLQIVEANFGVNKVNYEIKRSLEHEIIINEKGEVSVISTLQIDNLSRTEAWPGGRYKNFLRFYLPANTRLQKVLTRSGSDLQSQVNISGDEITKTVEQDKQVFGFLTEVIPGQSQAISIYYTLKDTIPIANSTSTYALYLQKQSGIESLPLTLTLRYPSHLNLTKITQSADFSSGSLVLKRDLKKDTVFAISFSP